MARSLPTLQLQSPSVLFYRRDPGQWLLCTLVRARALIVEVGATTYGDKSETPSPTGIHSGSSSPCHLHASSICVPVLPLLSETSLHYEQSPTISQVPQPVRLTLRPLPLMVSQWLLPRGLSAPTSRMFCPRKLQAWLSAFQV